MILFMLNFYFCFNYIKIQVQEQGHCDTVTLSSCWEVVVLSKVKIYITFSVLHKIYIKTIIYI